MSDEQFLAWGVVCDSCGVLPLVFNTHREAREEAAADRDWHEHPKPAVWAVRVHVALTVQNTITATKEQP